MPATNQERLLALVAATALLASPGAVFAQGSAGTSRAPQTSQTTPQEGPLSGTTGGRAGPNAQQGTGQAAPGNDAGTPRRGESSNREVPPHMRGQGHTSGRENPGSSTGRTQAPRDNAPGNPPSPNTPGRRSDAAPLGGAVLAAAGGGSEMAVDTASLRNARRASRMIGAAVYNESNESIGEVDDIVLPGDGRAPVAVVSVGGFLGIGAKLIAVPYERLRAAGERNRWTLSGAASREELGRLPAFSYDAAAAGRS